MSASDDTIDKGMRALDSVRHCEYAMTEEEATLDQRLRNTPPIDWVEADVDAIVAVAYRINNRP